MTAKGKYDTSGLIEAQFEPGSRGRVLKDLLGITSMREMYQVEARNIFEYWTSWSTFKVLCGYFSRISSCDEASAPRRSARSFIKEKNTGTGMRT